GWWSQRARRVLAAPGGFTCPADLAVAPAFRPQLCGYFPLQSAGTTRWHSGALACGLSRVRTSYRVPFVTVCVWFVRHDSRLICARPEGVLALFPLSPSHRLGSCLRLGGVVMF